MKEYALYRGDTFVDLGSASYLAKRQGVTKQTILYYRTPTYQKRNNYKGYVLIKIEDEN